LAEVVTGDADGLAGMLGALLAAAVEQPAKAAVLDRMRGTVTIVAPDAEVAVGLRFGNGVCRVSDGAIPGSTVRIEMPSETLLGFASIPLLYGLPSALTPEGRAFTLAVAKREVRISGLVRHLTLVRQLNTLLSVA
jgi:hypothetical protein